MIFEDLPTVPRSEELIDQAFSRAARAGRAKSGVEAQQSMLLTASNVLSDNLEHAVNSWPDFGTVDPFYRELADAVVRRELPGDVGEGETGVDALRQHLSEISWAARKTKELGREYQGRLGGDPDLARKLRKQGFARMADVVREVEDDLRAVGAARDALSKLPELRADEPAIVVAGYPNVGKSSLVNAVTDAENETAEYPFTTRGVHVGHVDRGHLRYQLVDTPGLLDRPPGERNEVEAQTVSALAHLADVVLVVVDPSITCGYPLDVQLELRDALAERFDVPLLTVANKADLSTAVDADLYTTLTGDPGAANEASDVEVVDPETVIDAAVDAVEYEPELPFEG